MFNTNQTKILCMCSEEFDLKAKWSQDPMKQMTQYIDTKEKITKRDESKTSNTIKDKYRDSLYSTNDLTTSQNKSTDLVEQIRMAEMDHKKSSNSVKSKFSLFKKKVFFALCRILVLKSRRRVLHVHYSFKYRVCYSQ